MHGAEALRLDNSVPQPFRQLQDGSSRLPRAALEPLPRALGLEGVTPTPAGMAAAARPHTSTPATTDTSLLTSNTASLSPEAGVAAAADTAAPASARAPDALPKAKSATSSDSGSRAMVSHGDTKAGAGLTSSS